MLLPESRNATYQWFKHRERELRSEMEKNGGKLPRHQFWRYQYYTYPYLLLETDEAIRERFVDVLANTVDLSPEGIVPTPLMQNDGRFGRVFTELIEETNSRGILTPDVVAEATAPIRAYFANGEPLGLRMFGDRQHIPGQWLVKYSKNKFVQDMHKFGRFRIAPASEYAKPSHIKAVKDLETARDLRLPALKDILEGRESLSIQGVEIRIRNGIVPIQLNIEDYYLFSTCKEIDRKLPTDFEADAALIIKDRPKFVERLKSALLQIHGDWDFFESEVYYYDPYRDVPKDMRKLEFWKSFSYAYQKEHRCVLKPNRRLDEKTKLEPIFVEIGPLDEISEVVVAK